MLANRAQLRRVLLAHQGLLGERAPGGTGGAVGWVSQQGFLPLDLQAHALAPGHDLALSSRLTVYQIGDLDLALYDGAQLFEHCLHVPGALPASDYALIHDPARIAATARPGSVGAEILHLLKRRGAVALRELQTSLREAGWSDRRSAGRAVHDLRAAGAIIVRRREGTQEIYDLAARVWPQTPPPLPLEERLHALAKRTLQILAPVTRASWAQVLNAIGSRARMGLEAMKREKSRLIAEMVARGEAVAVEIEDGMATYFIPSTWVPSLTEQHNNGSPPRVAFISALDPVAWDRQRAQDLFDFEWRENAYLAAPELRHTSGQVLAILYGEALVGRILTQMSWSRSRLLIHALHLDDPALIEDPHFRSAFGTALRALADLHEARDIQPTAPMPPRLLP